MFLKTSDFIGNEYIPNVNENSLDSNLLGREDILIHFIDEYEDILLIKLLGFKLAKEFKSKIDITRPSRIKDGEDSKWSLLMNGSTNIQYNGIIKLATAFVYFYYLEDLETSLSTVGNIDIKTKSADNASYRSKAIKAWNKFVNLVYGYNIKNRVRTKYNGLFSVDYSRSNTDEGSFYKFMIDNKDLYNDWVIDDNIELINHHGI